MSYDRQIEQVCPHQVIAEAIFFNEDRQTIRPLRPISNAVSVKVRVNGVQDVPMTGTHIPATAKGSLPGPFSIRAGVNDTLVVSVDGSADQTIVAPSGSLVTASALAKILSSKLPTLFFGTTKLQQIKAITATQGEASRVVFKDGSTLAETLGLTLNKVYRGQETFPSWSLILDPDTLNDRPTRLIMFDKPVSGVNDYVEVSYVTVQQECRRCGGTGIEHDWRYDVYGNIVEVRNVDLLMQEVLKVTYTARGSNPFYTWYGTGLLEAIGKKLTDNGIAQNLILSDIQETFQRWQSVKKQQEEDLGQFVSDEEYPFRLLLVNLEQDPDNPSIIYVHTVVQNRSINPIQISRGIRLPAPLDLMGSSPQGALKRLS